MPLLEVAARRASEAARPTDTVARPAVGGDPDTAAARGVAGAGAALAARVVSTDLIAALPVLDVAARRAFEAARPADVVDIPAAGVRTGAAGAVAVRAVAAARVAPAAWIPAFPVLDMA
ncbi:MAG: hypothetical protein QNJ87_02425 [Gammaproteobacteria bacterium]|nr:hypothetical protein [Gammaproteobacteria bacterium]MDJ0870606.1 hypothetical protein [Gammaproteobacteria bacterium]